MKHRSRIARGAFIGALYAAVSVLVLLVPEAELQVWGIKMVCPSVWIVVVGERLGLVLGFWPAFVASVVVCGFLGATIAWLTGPRR